MSKQKIVVIKSPIATLKGITDGTSYYRNQITYCVRLSNGMVITSPEEFPSEDEVNNDLSQANNETE